MNPNRNEESEYNALRQEILFHISNMHKFMVATIAAYAIVLFWTITNPNHFYIELVVFVLYMILILSGNYILFYITDSYRISCYIAIFHELKNKRIGWEILIKEFSKQNKPIIFGAPGVILIFLAIITLPIGLIEKINGMQKLTGNFYAVSIVSLFIIFMILSGFIIRKYHRQKNINLKIWIDIGIKHNFIKEDEIEKLKSHTEIL